MGQPNPFEVAYQDEQRRKEEERRKNPSGQRLSSRIGPLQTSHDVGEIVVGAEQSIELGIIAVIDGYAGGGMVSSRAAPQLGPAAQNGLLAHATDGFHVEDAVYGTPLLVGAESPRPIRAIFRPRAPGIYRSEIVIRVNWNDGNFSEQTVKLQGKARGLDDVPANAHMDVQDPATSSRRDPQLKKAPELDADLSTVETAANSARDSVDAITDAQKDGITLAEREALSFVEKPPEPSVLAILADIAISMGVAAIAGVLAKGAAKYLVGLQITDPAALKESKRLLALTDGFKDGIKGIAKEKIPRIAKPKTPEPKAPNPSGQFSSNAAFEFWARQRDEIGTVKAGLKKAVTREQNIASQMPAAAGVAYMNAMARSFHESGNNGEVTLAQALASETQWVSGIAQSSVGSAVARDRTDGDRLTSDLSWLRSEPKFALRDGVIRISVVRSHAGGAKVRGVRLDAISQEIADRLWRQPLLHVPVPVLLEVEDGAKTARITRDEAGRVRIASEILLPGDKPTESEPQMISDAEQIVEAVLSRSLSDWGVPEIRTNDATGRDK